MNVRKSDEFIADVERQFEWYVDHADWDVAERFPSAVEVTCGHACSNRLRRRSSW